jgi:hypothetical protein
LSIVNSAAINRNRQVSLLCVDLDFLGYTPKSVELDYIVVLFLVF